MKNNRMSELDNVKGEHIIVDLVNLNEGLCEDGAIWISAFRKAAESLGFEILETKTHNFSPPALHGMTGYLLLDSSHFSIHTYSKLGIAALDLFACQSNQLNIALEIVFEELQISKENINQIHKLERFVWKTPENSQSKN